ncbi:signal peptidase I [Oenococcus kitaharae]|uniref:Signal peptidase I n=1 Tax=Oenococcus kitaharae DSM 17330 TaxID=1045004 RepID=G9WEZ8_9LACO|nr:signal peptidase I [Oenococcus kitaharae]EHN58558.1 Signal peptidase I [Oenococcus kitaharae DSM 17330]OEY84727.1 signal peptidase [Oenococcus kitaharae]OEY85010.1 signal peptidase [Oenococcus kitaharae]OEY85801.1 signal peptidase [Oenococcus kitaharae]
MNKHVKYFLKIWLFPAFAGIAFAVFLRANYFSFIRISGQSMSPNLVNNQVVLLRKNQNVSRGTVVVFNTNARQRSDTGTTMAVLRVIGLPGDHIVFRKNKLQVNGKTVNQRFISKQQQQATSMSIDSGWSLNSLSLNRNWPRSQQNILKVKKNTYFVLADNRSMPTDSRKCGLIKKSQIQGSVQYYSWNQRTRMRRINSWSRHFFE